MVNGGSNLENMNLMEEDEDYANQFKSYRQMKPPEDATQRLWLVGKLLFFCIFLASIFIVQLNLNRQQQGFALNMALEKDIEK